MPPKEKLSPQAKVALLSRAHTLGAPMAREWPVVLAPDKPWQYAYGMVEAAAREKLALLPDGDLISTNRLSLWLWPKLLRKPEHGRETARLYRALNKLTVHGMADCCVLAGEQRAFGKVITSYLWSKPDPARAQAASARSAYGRAAIDLRKQQALAMLTDVAAVSIPGDVGFALSTQQRLDQLTRIVQDARTILEG